MPGHSEYLTFFADFGEVWQQASGTVPSSYACCFASAHDIRQHCCDLERQHLGSKAPKPLSLAAGVAGSLGGALGLQAANHAFSPGLCVAGSWGIVKTAKGLRLANWSKVSFICVSS